LEKPQEANLNAVVISILLIRSTDFLRTYVLLNSGNTLRGNYISYWLIVYGEDLHSSRKSHIRTPLPNWL